MKITDNIYEANAITHSGVFHGDDVMATAILSKYFDELIVCRTDKVPKNISKNVVVYDIGGGEFDHHQRGGNGERWNGVPYAAAGLIWKEFGKKIFSDLTYDEIDFVWRVVDKEIISGIDAVDCGSYPKVDYVIQAMNISALLASFNPTWDSSKDPDEAFIEAVEIASKILDNKISKVLSDIKAASIIEEEIENSENGILILEKFVSWNRFVHSSENPKAAEILFAIYPSIRGGYIWQCVTKEAGSYEVRKSVPREWWGATSYELSLMTGAETARFCHPSGFIGGAETFEDTLKMVKIAMES